MTAPPPRPPSTAPSTCERHRGLRSDSGSPIRPPAWAHTPAGTDAVHRYRPWTTPAAALGIAILVAAGLGCTARNPHRDTVLTLGSAPRTANPVTLAAAPTANGLLPPDRWPPACDLLTETDIHVVLPQTSHVEQISRDLTLRNEQPSAALPTITVTGGRCVITIRLPSTPKAAIVSLTVRVRAAGTPGVARINYQHIKNDTDCGPTTPDPSLDECSYSQFGQWAILKHGLAVDLSAAPPNLAGHFEHQGDTTIRDYWTRHVLRELIAAIAARLP